MSFEALVRPFTAPQSLGTRLIPSIITKQPTSDGIIRWGVAGTLIEPQEVVPVSTTPGDYGFQVRSCNTKSSETKRTATTQRITNPNDSSQYVDVQMPEEIFFELRPQQDILQSGFSGSTTSFANNDEIYSLIEDIVDPPNQQDVCQQSFSFKPGGLGS